MSAEPGSQPTRPALLFRGLLFAELLDRRMMLWNTRPAARIGLALLVGLLGGLGSAFWFFTPTIIYHPPDRLIDFTALCANPFERNLIEPFLAYRILTPATAWLLGLRGIWGLVLQYAGVAGLLAAVFALFRRELGNLAGLAAVAATGTTFAVIWTTGYAGFPDATSHAFVVLALLTRRPLAVCATLALAGLNDERAFLAAPLVVLWHMYRHPAGPWRPLFTYTASVAGAVLVVWSVRQALTHGLIGPGISRPKLYARIQQEVFATSHPWESTWGKFAWNVFMGFRWLWLLPLLAVLHPGSPANRRIFALALGAMSVASLSAAMVGDVSRTIGFLLPGVLLALRHFLLQPGISRWRWALALLSLQLFTPVLYHVSNWSGHTRPYPVELVRLTTGIDPVDAVLGR